MRCENEEMDWLELLHASQQKLSEVRCNVFAVSDALSISGNEALSERLRAWGSSLLAVEKTIERGVNCRIKEDMNSAAASDRALRSAMLGGAFDK